MLRRKYTSSPATAISRATIRMYLKYRVGKYSCITNVTFTSVATPKARNNGK